MRHQFSESLSTSVIATIAISCMLFGLLGLLNLWASDAADLIPAVTMFVSVNCLLAGLALAARLKHYWWLSRLLGLSLIVLGGLAFTGVLPDLSVYMPPILGATGFAFLFSSRYPFSKRLYQVAGALLLLLSSYLFGSLWLLGYATGVAENPIAFTGGMVFLTLMGVALLTLGSSSKATHKVSELSSRATLYASLVMICTTVTWLLLSNSDVENIKQRGQLNLKQSSEVISNRLTIQMDALERLVTRWNTIDSDGLSTLITLDLESYVRDFDLIEAALVYDRADADQPSQQISNTDEELAIVGLQKVRDWRQKQFAQQAAVVISETLATKQPRFLLSFPITNASIEPKQLLVIVNLKKLINIAKIDYLDFFKTYLTLSPQYLLPIGDDEFRTITEQQLKNQNFFWLTSELPVFGEQPMAFHAVLSDSSLLWKTATINQLLLIIGYVMALLLLMLTEANRSLRKERNKLFKFARYDTITPLIRRDVLEGNINQFLKQQPTSACSVLFIDLDGFKAVNDNLGLAVGNAILRLIAERILEHCDQGAQVARFSSDEYILFLPHRDIEASKAFAEQLLTSVRQKCDINGLDLYLTASIGIASPFSEKDAAEELIQNADVAMSLAKQLGGNTAQVFTAAMGVRYETELRLRNNIQRAIEHHEFEVYYQPYIKAGSKNIIGAEALVRWPQADGSFISPAEFIPVAEQTGQIVPLSELIMQQAFQHFSEWQTDDNFTLSINLSVKQFHRSTLVQDISSLSQHYHIPLNQLQFELTEHAMVEDAKHVERSLAELRTIGCRVAIDDFGTGFSSLAYLSRLPIDTIKIDREFTRSVYTDPANQAITKAIIEMAQGLGKNIIVEGIETEREAQFFTKQGCSALQGFLYFRPMPAKQMVELLGD